MAIILGLPSRRVSKGVGRDTQSQMGILASRAAVMDTVRCTAGEGMAMGRPVLEGVTLLHPLSPGPWGTPRVLEPASSRALGRVGRAETGWARAGCARDTRPTREYLVRSGVAAGSMP
jgi:hypothetical protein